MGNFRVVIDMVGGHGCQREYGDGDKVFGCRRMDCPDCITQEFVNKLRERYIHIDKAELIHWPDEPNSVTDEFIPAGRSIQVYETTEWIDNKPVKSGKMAQYIEDVPPHRVRHGWFPEHPNHPSKKKAS